MVKRLWKIHECAKSPRRRTSKAPSKAENVPNSNPFITFKNSSYSCLNWVISVVFTNPDHVMWLLIQIISTGNCFFKSPIKPTKPTKPTLPFTVHIISHHFTCWIRFFLHPEISQSTVYPSLQGREAIVVPGVDLGPRPSRPRHQATEPQQVPHSAEVAEVGRQDDVVVAYGGARWKGKRPNKKKTWARMYCK